MTEVTISFPGIGIEPFVVNKIAFSFGNLEVRWYGILLTLGIMLGVCYAIFRSKHEGISTDDVLDFAIWTVLLAIIGARLYYVLTTLKNASGGWNYHSFVDVIAIWEGGIAMYGSIIGGALALIIVSKVKKYDKSKILKLFDMVAPGVMLGQIIGRWGNFVNGEAHGIEVSENFFLRMGLMGAADGASYKYFTYFHPTFLYESAWNLIGFILINAFYKKKKFDGQITLAYLAWYGFGRMFIEGLRTDSLYIGVFRISQVIGFLCFVICTTLMVLMLHRQKRATLDEQAYAPVYEKSLGFGVRRTSSVQEDEDERAGSENDKEN